MQVNSIRTAHRGGAEPEIVPAEQGVRLARSRPAATTITVVTSAADLEQHVAAWQDLANNAIERNAFYEPWLLLPAISELGRGTRLLFVLVYECAPDGRAAFETRLCGFFPLELATQMRGVPVQVLRLWKHIHCFLCAPLIRQRTSRETLAALLAWAASEVRADIVDFSYISGDGPLQQALVEHANETDGLSCSTSSFTRALWRRRGIDAEAYLEAVLSGGVRKEYRRQYRRLEELGRLEFRSTTPATNFEMWLDHFLRLEASGWKARQGTALAMHEEQRRFIMQAASAGWARGQAGMHGLFLDDRPIAMLLCFQSGAGLFAYKIAYDEAFAKFSPGVQMTLQVLAKLHAEPAISWLDSCAMPDHPMINRLLSDRRIVQSVLLSTGTWKGDVLVSAWPLGRWASRTARATLRRLSQNRKPASSTLAAVPRTT